VLIPVESRSPLDSLRLSDALASRPRFGDNSGTADLQLWSYVGDACNGASLLGVSAAIWSEG
jgi:hypothetical protein